MTHMNEPHESAGQPGSRGGRRGVDPAVRDWVGQAGCGAGLQQVAFPGWHGRPTLAGWLGLPGLRRLWAWFLPVPGR